MNDLNFRAMTEDLQPRTGKSWQDWGELLDAWGGETKNLTTIATYLMLHYQLRQLYAQMIAVYYKRDWRSLQTKV
jgi:hypothetical protein